MRLWLSVLAKNQYWCYHYQFVAGTDSDMQENFVTFSYDVQGNELYIKFVVFDEIYKFVV